MSHPDALKRALKAQAIETPSWGYGSSGTRFKTFPLLREARQEVSVPEDPVRALRKGDYQQTRAQERGTAAGGGGYPSSD